MAQSKKVCVPNRIGSLKRGLSLIEVLLAIALIAVCSIGTLSYFSVGLGGVNRQGNRRAALERARQRMEQLVAAAPAEIRPPADGQTYGVAACDGSEKVKCSWKVVPSPAVQTVTVNDMAGLRMETSVRYIDDVDTAVPDHADVLVLGVKVWFVPSPSLLVDDADSQRVQLQALRTL
jgi:prepilin-type N-terminal cleavage/methylation domain-containing protein